MKIFLFILLIAFSFSAFSQDLNVKGRCLTSYPCQMGTFDPAGIIQLIITGGTPPYEAIRTTAPYFDTVDTYSDTITFIGLSVGEIQFFEVTDGNFLYNQYGFYTGELPSPFQLIVTPPACMTCCNGAVYAVPIQTIPPDWHYAWDPSGDTNSFILNACPGDLFNFSGQSDTNSLCVSISSISIDSVAIPTDSISGHVFIDANGNGLEDSFEYSAPNVFIALSPVNGFTQTDTSGNYQLKLPTGNYDVSVNPPPGWQITSSPVMYNVNLNGFAGNLNFGINMPGNNGSISVNAFNDWPRCNQNVKHYIEVTNTGPVPFDSVKVQFTFSSNMIFTSATPVVSSSAGNTLQWTLAAMQPLSVQRIYAFFNLPVAGNVINYTATVSAWIGGSMVATNTYSNPVTIACSFDPNDIAVTPVGTGPQHYVPMGQNFEYLVRFQNTGNDTAYDISVHNPIDASLDLSTFRLLSSSHPVEVKSLGNLIKFNFNHIMLPDSNRDEPGSNGYVRYSISPKNNLPDPTTVNNAAFIYFDQNDPVPTNVVSNTLSNTLGVGMTASHKVAATVFPNPVSDQVNIHFPKDYNCIELSLYDSKGRCLFRKVNPPAANSLNISAYAKGTYIIRYTDKKGNSGVNKIIKD